MKRPQFGLRLMLLVVALFATIFAATHWQKEAKRREYFLQSPDIEYRLRRLEDEKTQLKTTWMDPEIAKLKAKLEALKP